MTDLTPFRNFLISQGLTPATIETYTYQVGNYLLHNPDAEQYRYKDVLAYFSDGPYKDSSRAYKNTILGAIKRYYDFLIHTGTRNDHPARRLFLKGPKRNRQVIIHDLFTSEELELLMEREERYPMLRLSHQAAISLLIYQGITSGELAALRTTHLDLDRGTIYLPGTKKLARRHLELIPRQYRLMDRYLAEARPALTEGRPATEALILGKLGTPIGVDGIHYLIETSKPLFPGRNLNPETIRQSVISNWLNERGWPLEQVQLLAGHKWISTTAAYRHPSADKERELINRWHPLG